MSDKEEGGGLFRRMARKVAAPARELVGMSTPRETDIRATEFDKAEMKAMIERKRRNDYVRKRELDTLRRIRREGLSGDQAQALTMQSSRMDENVETRSTQSSVQSVGIKAKIDAIERQMVGASSGVSAGGPPPKAPPPPRTAPTLPPGPPPPILTTTIFDPDESAATLRVPLTPDDENETVARLDGGPLALDGPDAAPEGPTTAPATLSFANTMPYDGGADPFAPPRGAAPPAPDHAPLEFTHTPVPAAPPAPPLQAPAPAFQSNPYAAGAPAPRTAPGAQATVNLGGGESVEISEVVHDEALDEAVIAFAGGDFAGCEKALQALVGPRGERRDHDETWLVLFDLYRAIGQQTKFETVTMEYVERFHRSAPQWFSLPKQLAESTKKPEGGGKSIAGGIGWVCPPNLDGDAVSRLDALSMQLPSPWVMDWTALETIDVEGASRLQKLFLGWANQPLSLSWVAGEKLFSVLHDMAPTGVRDADPVYWMLRLEALRLAHRPDQFDEVAIDYCVTFEVSPPSWENARCKAQLSGTTQNTQTLSLSVVGEATTSFMDTSMLAEETAAPAQVQITSVELAGQLSGDMSELLNRLSSQVGDSRVIRISCALLMRVDFVAAGDLLNWVAQRHGEGREIVFHETHRLVALMFGAMGINETARVQLRHI